MTKVSMCAPLSVNRMLDGGHRQTAVRWLLTCTCALIMAVTPERASAQFGLGGGLNMADLVGDLIPTSMRPGATGGLFLGWKGIQSELYFVPKGAIPESSVQDDDQAIRLDYVEMPVMVRLKAGPLYMMVGPSFGMQLRCYAVLREEGYDLGGNCDDLNGTNVFDSVDYSGVVSMGLNLAKLLSLDLRMISGMTGIGSAPVLEELTNRSYSFTARIPFGGD
jgi:hypothetical protein